MRVAPAAVLLVLTGLVAGCGGGDDGTDDRRPDDCAARLGLDGDVYEPLGRPPQGAGVGRADRAEVLGCEDEVVAEVAVRRLPPRGATELLVVRSGPYRGFYLREDAAPSPVPLPPPSATAPDPG